MIPIAIFVRVSTKNQEYERQISDLTAYAQKQAYQVVEVITEVKSATKTKAENRVAISRLFDLAKTGTIKKVLVSEISRLGRKTSEVLSAIEDLSAAGISVYAHNYNLETLDNKGKRNPVASLMFTLLAEFARMETETLAERIRSGKEESKKKGIHQGRKKGTTEPSAVLLKKYPGVVKDLKAGISIRKVAAIREVSKMTVAKVKKLINDRLV